MTFRIFTDASFLDREKIAGIGIVVCKNESRKCISYFSKARNVNEAELIAIYTAAILAGSKPCEIITDSQTALSYIKGEINIDKPRTHEQYISFKQQMFWAYKIRNLGRNIKFTKIKSHTGYYQIDSINNQIADQLAKEGVTKYLNQQKILYDKNRRGRD